MKDFATQLKHHIEEKNIKISPMARFLAIDRSSLYQMITGKRPPSSAALVEQIANYLCLTPQERSVLMEGYYWTLHGRPAYEADQSIKAFINGFTAPQQQNPYPWSPTAADAPQRDAEVLTTPTNLDNALICAITKEQTRPDAHLTLLTQPGPNALYLLVNHLVKSPMGITQIMCLDNSSTTPSANTNYNIQCLDQVFSLMPQHPEYQAYYYYDQVHAHFNMMSLYPYLVLTHDTAILFNADYSAGLSFHLPEIVAAYRDAVQGILSQCSPLFTPLGDVLAQCQYYNQIPFEGFKVIEAQPCILGFITGSLLDDVLKENLPQREELIHIVQPYLQNRGAEFECGQGFSYFTGDGLRDIAKTGIVTEIPQGFYHPLTLTHRIQVIKRVLHFAQLGQFKMLKGPFEHFSPNMTILIQPGRLTISKADSHQPISCAMLEESTLSAAFEGFADRLGDYGCLASCEETIAFIEGIILELEGQLP